MLSFNKLNLYLEERMLALYEKQFYPAIFAFIGLGVGLFFEQVRSSEVLLRLLLLYFVFFIRIILTVVIERALKAGRFDRDKLQKLELFTAIFYALLGFSYAYYIFLVNIAVGHEVIFLAYTIFFFFTLGALRVSSSSYLVSLGMILGGYLSSIFIWRGQIRYEFEYLFLYIAIPAFIIYLLKSQYDLALEFVERINLLKKQERHISDLQSKIELEEELKRQKRISAQNSRLAALGQMASGIAHEINNPLTIISLNIKALFKRKEQGRLSDQDLESTLQQILDAVNRVSKIITSLRALARDDKLSNIESVPVVEVVDESTAIMQQRFYLEGIELRITYRCDRNIAVMVNKVAVAQVLVNLLSNAFYEMKKRSKQESRWCEIIIENQHQALLIKVVDAGEGVPLAHRNKLFTPFFTSKKVGEGTGLGLSISKTMMQDMEGELYYDEHAFHTTFVMKLKLAEKKV